MFSRRRSPSTFQKVPVAEVGRAGERDALLGGGLQPQQRPPHEQLGRHEVDVHAIRELHQVKPDQAHVVRQRHPAQRGIVRRCTCRPPSRLVVLAIRFAMSQHHALRFAGGSGGELNECQVRRRRPDELSGFRDVGDRFHQEGARFELCEQGSFAHLLRRALPGAPGSWRRCRATDCRACARPAAACGGARR